MRLAFVDFCGWDFHAQTVDSQPLGGSQSAACYLSRALAAQGHDVFLFSKISVPGTYDGVRCLHWPPLDLTQVGAPGLDALVCLLGAGFGVKLRQAVWPRTRLILWNQHAADQPAVQSLRNPRERDVYDGFAMVSEWQRATYHKAFGIGPARMAVLRNAIAPAFANLFPESAIIAAQKASPPILAYTSTPFRGLDLLIGAFPHIRAAVPGARLQVFSSMKVYQTPATEDDANFGGLYQRCRETPGVEYIGSLPQPELARAMRSVAVLAYPNTFAETSCITVMEALAGGCRVVTSALGALPETTAGFARLIPVGSSWEAYMRLFIEQVVQACRQCADTAGEQDLRRQVAFINATATWDLRARQWTHWLQNMSPRVAPQRDFRA